MTRPCWLGRAARNRHRHAIEQAARRWRGGRREDSARTCRKILISTQNRTILTSLPDEDRLRVLDLFLLNLDALPHGGVLLAHNRGIFLVPVALQHLGK